MLLATVLPAPTFAQEPPRAALKYRADLVRQSRLIWGLEAPVAVMAAQVHQESAWRPDAHSIYAHGLAQFTPATADWIGGIDPELIRVDTGNPVWALRALARYDRWLYERVPLTPTPPGPPLSGGGGSLRLAPSPDKGRAGEGLSLRLAPSPDKGRAGEGFGVSADCTRWSQTLRAYNGGLGWLRKEAKSGQPCTAFRAAWACRENLAYPVHILIQHQPRYARWGGSLLCPGSF